MPNPHDTLMLAIPAIDLRGGACVQVADAYDANLITSTDPSAIAAAWRQSGFSRLHVIDLDAAAGRGNNGEQIAAIVNATDAETQVGGGVRDREMIEQVLSFGARRIVIGSKALTDPDWLADMSALFPQHIVVAMDVRDRRILADGWTRSNAKLLLDVVEELNDLPLAALMLTAVAAGESIRPADLALLEDVAELAEFPVYVSGGLNNLNDLRVVADRGIAAAILGVALYDGGIDPRVAAEEFADGGELFI